MKNTTRTLLLAGIVILTATSIPAQAQLERSLELLHEGMIHRSEDHANFQEMLDALLGRPEGIGSLPPLGEPTGLSEQSMNAAIQKLLQAQIDLITEHALLRTTLERYLERMPSLRECVEPVDDLLRVE